MKILAKIGAGVLALTVSAGLVYCKAIGVEAAGDEGKKRDALYSVVLGDGAAGNFEVRPGVSVEAGTEITLTYTGNDGRYVNALKIKPADSDEGFELNGAGPTWAFAMPDDNVTVNAALGPPSADATLKSLTVAGKEPAGFNSATSGTASTIEVPYGDGSVKLHWTAAFGASATKVQMGTSPVSVDAGGVDATVRGLVEAPVKNEVTIEVTAQNGTNKEEYKVAVTRRPDLGIREVSAAYTSGASDATSVASFGEDSISVVLPYRTEAQLGIHIKVTQNNSDAAVEGDGIFAAMIGGTVDITGVERGPNKKKTGTIKVRKGSFTSLHTLTVVRAGDPLYPTKPMATGGARLYIGAEGVYDEVHIFRVDQTTGANAFTLAVERAPVSAKAFLVAGGGGGGNSASNIYPGGGGGAGGVINGVSLALSQGNYSVTVGKGGAGGTEEGTGQSVGDDSSVPKQTAGYGGDSIIAGGTPETALVVAKGGGGGGGNKNNGGNGGSGGGSGNNNGNPRTGGRGVANQGNNGSGAKFINESGGGGGFTAEGGGGKEGKGGAGILRADVSMLDGIEDRMVPKGFAGGGNGGSNVTNENDYGAGLGGSSPSQTAVGKIGGDGGADTGSGGGGGRDGGSIATPRGGSGGSGIVIIRFPYIQPAK